MQFKDKLALVTGAASGIGAAAARLLVQGGAHVLVTDIDPAGVDRITSELKDNVTGFVADISDQAAVEEVVATAVGRLGGLDIMVNNAGIGSLARTVDLDPAEWRKVMAIDLDAVFYAFRKALPHLIERRGSIVNTASISGLAADYGFTAYNVAKAGLIAFTRVMAIDYAAQGVRVNSISPGFTATPLVAMMPESVTADFLNRVPMRRAGTAEEMAAAVCFLASDAASYITGHNLIVDGGLTAHTGQPNVLATFQTMMAAAAAANG